MGIPMGRGIYWGKQESHCKATFICAKIVEPIEMPFGLWAQMGQRNRVLDRGPELLSNFWLLLDYNFGFIIASDTLFDSSGGFSGSSYPMKT